MPSTGQLTDLTAPDVDAVNEMIGELFPGSNNSCVELGRTVAVARREVSEAELRPGAFISGPSQFGLADAALWYLVFGATGRIEPMALTSELSIRFLRPAQGSVLWARATLAVAGHYRNAFLLDGCSLARRAQLAGHREAVHGLCWCPDGKPTATAQGTYVLPH